MSSRLKRILSIVGTLIFITLIYLVRIKTPVVSIDTENFINNPTNIITLGILLEDFL